MQQLTWLYHVLSILIYFFVELNPFFFLNDESLQILIKFCELKANQHYQKKNNRLNPLGSIIWAKELHYRRMWRKLNFKRQIQSVKTQISNMFLRFYLHNSFAWQFLINEREEYYYFVFYFSKSNEHIRLRSL